MSNTIIIKHGSEIPTIENLKPFELGYVPGKGLYINDGEEIVLLAAPVSISTLTEPKSE